MKRLILTALATSATMVAVGQSYHSETPVVEEHSSSNNPYAINTYAEALGPGLASLNMDMRFNKSQRGFGGRIGLGALVFDTNSIITIPIGVNYLFGKISSPHLFELGANITGILSSRSSNNPPSPVSVRRSDPLSGTFVGTLNFGYRYQPADEGLTFRVAINPVIYDYGYFPFWGGVSVGYKF